VALTAWREPRNRGRVGNWLAELSHRRVNLDTSRTAEWKWLDSGDVEFRLHAVSEAADTGPWLLRTGFRVLGRTNQLASTARSAGESPPTDRGHARSSLSGRDSLTRDGARGGDVPRRDPWGSVRRTNVDFDDWEPTW
jgi:hypothetical protein